MFGNSGTLRHLPFFEEVATHEEHESDWRAAAAGLVTLRLIDTWIEDGPAVVAPESTGVVAVLKAIDAMDTGSTLPNMLRAIVQALQGAAAGEMHDVFPRILAYGRGLEYEAKWLLALDVYDSVVAHAHPIQESDSAAAAHQRRGASLRTIGRFEEALVAYSLAELVAQNVDDMIGVLRAKIGIANVAIVRGNLAHADKALEAIERQAGELRLTEQQAIALDSRAAAAGIRGDYELAVKFAYDALRVASEPAERDRILNNIGMAFHRLGIRSAARDAFLLLSVTAQEQYIRWTAMLSLMTLAAEDGSEPAFEQIRKRFPLLDLPPEVQVDYFIHLGRAQRALEHEGLAEIAFTKAVELAEQYGLNRQLFEAEAELNLAQLPCKRSQAVDAPIGDLADVVSGVHELRLHTGPLIL